MRDVFYVDPLPESVWHKLPGGPEATDDVTGESWQYMGSAELTESAGISHSFRHRNHPKLGGRAYAWIVDNDAGPVLARLIANGEIVSLDARSRG